MPRRGRRHRAREPIAGPDNHMRSFLRVHIRSSKGGGGAGFIYAGQPMQCTKSCCRVFLAILIMLVGSVVTMVGYLHKPFWGPEHDWCDFCREDRLNTERRLSNCRIVGPIFLGVGSLMFVVFSCLLHQKSKNDQTQSSSDVEGLQTSTAAPAAVGVSLSEMTGVVVYPPPPPPADTGMPGFTYSQSPLPALMRTAPYPPYVGGDFAYPPSTAHFSFPTAVELENPQPAYEAAVAPTVAADGKSDEANME